MNTRFFILALCGALSGCATVNSMAFNKSSKTVDVSVKSVLVMTLDLSRPEESRYVPRPLVVHIERPNAQSAADRQNFKVDDADKIASEGNHNIYVLRMALDPGQYQLKGVFGNANAFPFNGFFFVPLLMDVTVAKNSVSYLGRVEAVLRPRTGNEFRAGSVIPLIDQSVTGVSGGTFDVVVKDSSSEDIPMMRATFPALANIEINTALLPAFDRAKAQRWWESDGANTESKAAVSEPPAPAGEAEKSQ